MGTDRWSEAAYESSSRDYASKPREAIFTKKEAREVDGNMLPHGVKMRESRDSTEHPESLAVMIDLDVTGSMRDIPENLVKGKLGEVMNTLIKHGILHPQIMFCAVGDHECDSVPLQISQFESGDEKIQEWLTKIFLEGGGGSNYGESYILAWYFAAFCTSIDCFEKRGQKGFIFTIGDEPFLRTVPADSIEKIFGVKQQGPSTAEQLLAEAQKTYHVFHIHIEHAGRNVSSDWKTLLGQNLIVINDPEIVAEVIASTVATVHGVDLATVTASFDSVTATKVTTALAHVETSLTKTKTKIIDL